MRCDHIQPCSTDGRECNPQDLVLFDLFSALQDAGVIRSVITGSRLYSEVPIGE